MKLEKKLRETTSQYNDLQNRHELLEEQKKQV